MFNLVGLKDLDAIQVGDYRPKPTTLTPGQQEATAHVYTSPTGDTKIGIWECTPGEFTADRSGMAEYCHILSGSATITDADGGRSVTLGANDFLALPKGWKGTWAIHSHVRKLYFLVENAN